MFVVPYDESKGMENPRGRSGGLGPELKAKIEHPRSILNNATIKALGSWGVHGHGTPRVRLS